MTRERGSGLPDFKQLQRDAEWLCNTYGWRPRDDDGVMPFLELIRDYYQKGYTDALDDTGTDYRWSGKK